MEAYLSDLGGDKKALLIGLGFYDTPGISILQASPNTAKAMAKWLMKYHSFKEENITLITDEEGNASATRDAILLAMEAFVGGAKANDSLFFFISSHGGQMNKEGQEHEGMDEFVSVPGSGKEWILDDEFYNILVRRLPDRCRLTAVVDACYSGTMFDLPYEFNEKGQQILQHHPTQPGGLKDPNFEFIESWALWYNPELTNVKKALPKDVLLFSSSKDRQYSNQSKNLFPHLYGEFDVQFRKMDVFSQFFMEYATPSKNPTPRSILQHANEGIKVFRYSEPPVLVRLPC